MLRVCELCEKEFEAPDIHEPRAERKPRASTARYCPECRPKVRHPAAGEGLRNGSDEHMESWRRYGPAAIREIAAAVEFDIDAINLD